jgi:hypothetical protein
VDLSARLLAKSDGMFEDLGATRGWWDSERNDSTREILRTSLDEDALEEGTRLGRELTADEAVALALDSVD